MRIFEISFNFPIIRHEPRHNKTNKMSAHPAQTQISLGICQVFDQCHEPERTCHFAGFLMISVSDQCLRGALNG